MSSMPFPSNSSTCNGNSLPEVPYHLSCGVPLLANGSSINSSSSSPVSYPNNNTALLLSCCASGNNGNPAVVAPYPSSYPGDSASSCYIYCNNSDMTHALQTYWCLGNLSATTANENVTDGVVIFGCGFSGGAAAAAGGRWRGGGGGMLVWLGMGVAFWVLVMGLEL